MVFGTEFGGGKKVRAIARTPRRAGHRRRTTQQFVTARPFIYPAISRNYGWALDRFADVVFKVLEKVGE